MTTAPIPSSPVIQPSPGSTKRPSARSLGIRAAVSVLWLLGYPFAIAALGTLGYGTSPPDWIFFLILLENLAWLAAAYCIYDTLFTIAAMRWPAAKMVREIVGPLLQALLFHHHHS